MKLRHVILVAWLAGWTAPFALAADLPSSAPLPVLDPQVLQQLKAAQNIVGDIRRQTSNPQKDAPSVDSLKARLNTTIQGIPQAFRLLEPPLSAPKSTFHKITLNQNSLGFDGFRIKNNSTEPRKFAWACAFKASSPVDVWHIVPVTGTMKGFSKYHLLPPDLHNVPWKDAPKPYKGFCQSLDSAEIKPGEEYIIWFSFTSSRPQEIYVLYDLLPADLATKDVKDILKALSIE